MAKLCLNMIVKNETANLLRCLCAVAPHIACYSITDTGSTDGTPEMIRAFFANRNIPGEVCHGTFENFSQARNLALDNARAMATDDSAPYYDYLLLVDADMELVIDPNFAVFDGLTKPAYSVIQRCGNMAYWNVRLLHRDSKARYVGVTHEFLAADNQEQLAGAWFLDHASGSNRPNKLDRDIKLLSAEVDNNPRDERSWFYLANSLREKGLLSAAVDAYQKRIDLRGWDEEVYCAMLYQARCYRDMQNEAAFVRTALAAYNFRRCRAESLYDLSRYFREKGQNHTALIFTNTGASLPIPHDLLFVETFPYHAGFREEFSICAFYDDAKRNDGFHVCNDLALDPTIPESTRILARSNLYHYLPRLVELGSSFRTKKVDLPWVKPYTCMNPSITACGNRMAINMRTVNYRITESGHYDMQGDTAIRTRNFLCDVNDDLEIAIGCEILSPFRAPLYPDVIGFEDVRLIACNGRFYASANVREQNAEGWCEQWLSRIDPFGMAPEYIFADPRPMFPPHRQNEKNWMPRVDGDTLTFIYDPFTVIDTEGKELSKYVPPLAVAHFRGGSQAIQFDGGWLALIHEAGQRPGDGQRFYQHRFVWFDHDNKLTQVSLPFVFNDRVIEFAAGMCRHPKTGALVISYGFQDREAWLGTIDANDVRGMLNA